MNGAMPIQMTRSCKIWPAPEHPQFHSLRTWTISSPLPCHQPVTPQKPNWVTMTPTQRHHRFVALALPSTSGHPLETSLHRALSTSGRPLETSPRRALSTSSRPLEVSPCQAHRREVARGAAKDHHRSDDKPVARNTSHAHAVAVARRLHPGGSHPSHRQRPQTTKSFISKWNYTTSNNNSNTLTRRPSPSGNLATTKDDVMASTTQ
jgi:hypothetical protein